jgi:hypothetical protein
MAESETIPSNYLWCLHCERTFERNTARIEGQLQMCAYEDCNGTLFADAWNWEKVRDYRPEYPVIPELGQSYPLYS